MWQRTRNDGEIQPVKRRNCQIMTSEKARCDSHCSWSIRSYNNNVWEVYWKPWNWDQNWTFSEISIVRNSYNKKKGTILLSTRGRILLWDLWHLVDGWSHIKHQRCQNLSSVRDNIEHNNNNNDQHWSTLLMGSEPQSQPKRQRRRQCNTAWKIVTT